MNSVYNVLGMVVFWSVITIVALATIFVGVGLWQDRRKIRWPWRKRQSYNRRVKFDYQRR